MLYVEFRWPSFFKKRALFSETWFDAWNSEWVVPLLSKGEIRIYQKLGIDYELFEANSTPATAPSHALVYGSDSMLQLYIDCLEKRRGTWINYYYYDGWNNQLILSSIGHVIFSYNTNVRIPLNSYNSIECIIDGKPSLNPPPSLKTIVPTQLSSLV